MRKKLAALTMCAALAAGSLYGCAPEDGTSASAAAPDSTEAGRVKGRRDNSGGGFQRGSE